MKAWDANGWFRIAAQELLAQQLEIVIDRPFRGTPYDFGCVVSEFITDYYDKDPSDWTGCTITPQQEGVSVTMPNCSVEIECPTSSGGLPAYAWLTARRLPDGGSNLRIESDSREYADSPQLQIVLEQLMETLALWVGEELPPPERKASDGEDAPAGAVRPIGEVIRPADDAPLIEWEAYFNPPGRSGRPSLRDDIWASVEIWIKERDKYTVYREWKNREGVKGRDLLSPEETFDKFIRSHGKKLGKK